MDRRAVPAPAAGVRHFHHPGSPPAGDGTVPAKVRSFPCSTLATLMSAGQLAAALAGGGELRAGVQPGPGR